MPSDVNSCLGVLATYCSNRWHKTSPPPDEPSKCCHSCDGQYLNLFASYAVDEFHYSVGQLAITSSKSSFIMMYILVIHKFEVYITQHCSFNFGMCWGMILLVE